MKRQPLDLEQEKTEAISRDTKNVVMTAEMAKEVDLTHLEYAEAFVLYKKAKIHVKALVKKMEQEEEKKAFNRAMATLPKLFDEMILQAKLQNPQKFHKMVEYIEEYMKEESQGQETGEKDSDDFCQTFAGDFHVHSLFEKAIRLFPNVYLCSKEVKVKDRYVPCVNNEECWYESNDDRIGKSVDMYYSPLSPRVMICEVCLDNHDNFWEEMFEEHGFELHGLDKYVYDKLK